MQILGFYLSYMNVSTALLSKLLSQHLPSCVFSSVTVPPSLALPPLPRTSLHRGVVLKYAEHLRRGLGGGLPALDIPGLCTKIVSFFFCDC